MSCRAVLALLFQAVALFAHGQTTAYPLESAQLASAPYNVSGMVYSRGVGGVTVGSGAVVRHAKVVASCAHLLYSTVDGTPVFPWRTDNYWIPRWHDQQPPTATNGVPLRGFYFFADYSSFAQRYQVNGAQTFANDFVAHFSYEELAQGAYAGYWSDGAEVLASDRAKIIVGYPSGLYSANDWRRYLMHQTGPFYQPFQQHYEQYMLRPEVSAGPGNSGGPVFVADGANYYFAAVYIAGLERRRGDSLDVAGVYALDTDALKLMDQAVADAERADPHWNFRSDPMPKIAIRGRNEEIRSNDLSPRILDATDFGNGFVGGSDTTRDFMIVNQGTAPLVVGPVVIRAMNRIARSAFRIIRHPESELEPGGSSMLRIRFRRARPGNLYAQVAIPSNDPGVPEFTFSIKGRNRNR